MAVVGWQRHDGEQVGSGGSDSRDGPERSECPRSVCEHDAHESIGDDSGVGRPKRWRTEKPSRSGKKRPLGRWLR